MNNSSDSEWPKKQNGIAVAGNTGSRCLMAIREKGYDIRLNYEKRNKHDANYKSNYEAQKDGQYFYASSPEELLGIIAMWEVRGKNWKNHTEEEWDYCEELDEKAKIYDENGDEIWEE